MLEEKIDALTTQVKRLADLYEGGKGGAPAAGATAAKADKPKADKPKATKHTAAAVSAAIQEVKEKVGTDVAKAIIEEHAGSGAKLAVLMTKPEKFDAAMASCEAAIAALADGGDDDDDDDI